MTDVGTAFLRAYSAFASTQLGKASGTTLKDTGSLLSSLTDGTPNAALKAQFEQLKTDIQNMQPLVTPIADAIEPKLKVIANMATASAAEAQIAPFTIESAGRIATNVATALIALDDSIEIIATQLAKGDKSIHDAIVGIEEPWIAPFRNLGGGTQQSCSTPSARRCSGSITPVLAWRQRCRSIAITIASPTSSSASGARTLAAACS